MAVAFEVASLACKCDIATLNRETGEPSRPVNIRRACRQRCARRVDKTATIACDAIGVSDDNIGPPAKNFCRPQK